MLRGYGGHMVRAMTEDRPQLLSTGADNAPRSSPEVAIGTVAESTPQMWRDDAGGRRPALTASALSF